MNDHAKSCHRLLTKWCAHKASEERAKVGRCRTAYKDPVLSGLTNRYADALEASARIFEDMQSDLERIVREAR